MSYGQWCPTCCAEVVSVTRGIPSMGTCENGHTFDRRDALRRKPDPQDEITALRAQLAAAEADKLEAMERVREAAVKRVKWLLLGRPRVVEQQITKAILALDLDALAEGDG